jgi:dUTPase
LVLNFRQPVNVRRGDRLAQGVIPPFSRAGYAEQPAPLARRIRSTGVHAR